MYKKIYIENFRCFDKITIDGLKEFNIIIGKNNVGKTAFLEAFFLHMGAHNPEITFKIDGFRGIVGYELEALSIWSSLFHNLWTQSPIIIRTWDELYRMSSSEISIAGEKVAKAKIDTKKSGIESTDFNKSLDRLKLTYKGFGKKETTAYAIIEGLGSEGAGIKFERPEDMNYRKGIFVSTITPKVFEREAHIYGNLQITNKEKMIISSLQKIEPRLKKILIVPIRNRSAIYADIGFEKAIPISLLGEGVVRLFQILLAIAEIENGLVFIDEIERGFHFEFYKQAIQIISEFAHDLKSQIITTTHNRELLKATHQIFKGKDRDALLMIRLDKVEDKVKPTYYDMSKLNLVFEEGWEIR